MRRLGGGGKRGRYLGDAEELRGVTFLPVTEFVCKNSDNLLGLALLNQGIKDDNVLAPGETVEVGVAVSAALGTIDNVEVLQRELESASQSLNFGAQLTRLKRTEFVK